MAQYGLKIGQVMSGVEAKKMKIYRIKNQGGSTGSAFQAHLNGWSSRQFVIFSNARDLRMKLSGKERRAQFPEDGISFFFVELGVQGRNCCNIMIFIARTGRANKYTVIL